MVMTTPARMLMYGKEASNRKQEIDRQHYTIYSEHYPPFTQRFLPPESRDIFCVYGLL